MCIDLPNGKFCFLRIRGGVSIASHCRLCMAMFSPRTRRCFLLSRVFTCQRRVFSAYAEVFLLILEYSRLSKRFLRVRGGVSFFVAHFSSLSLFSPRTRRCFRCKGLPPCRGTVFSAYAEVFLTLSALKAERLGFLRVRGGVSSSRIYLFIFPRFSPRTRRCFHNPLRLLFTDTVFSAYAEVFLYIILYNLSRYCFLRVRGGVSEVDFLFLHIN